VRFSDIVYIIFLINMQLINLYHAVDKSLLGQGFDGEILHFLKIASSCIHPILDQRPTMLQAFQMLMVLRGGERERDSSKILSYWLN